MTILEFWPDYGAGPLWSDGKPADLASLGLGEHLRSELTEWNARYEEDNLPLRGDGDAAWLSQGRDLLCQTRAALTPTYEVVVTEPWWVERPI
ncbi:MAG TPA: hypothetical protein VNQ53_07825 [Nocardioides sp.]|nr:hypothetical protein [Nocardioides sp.]